MAYDWKANGWQMVRGKLGNVYARGGWRVIKKDGWHLMYGEVNRMNCAYAFEAAVYADWLDKLPDTKGNDG
jgi:hypothetical protein